MKALNVGTVVQKKTLDREPKGFLYEHISNG
jgi:hypothetical protein